jgi:hypothetical protein
MLRRKRLPTELGDAYEGFRRATHAVDRAHGALTEAAPTTRFAGRPLPDALVVFEEALREARADMERWHVPELEADWERCSTGITASLSLAERLRVEAPEVAGFESLIGTIDQLLAPLDAFETASERFRSLRR